jgi:hypothetical protein
VAGRLGPAVGIALLNPDPLGCLNLSCLSEGKDAMGSNQTRFKDERGLSAWFRPHGEPGGFP